MICSTVYNAGQGLVQSLDSQESCWIIWPHDETLCYDGQTVTNLALSTNQGQPVVEPYLV